MGDKRKMTEEQIKAKAKEQFPNDEFAQQIIIDAINWATKELEKENAELRRNEFNARSCLELQQSQDKAIVNYMGEQLTKAKEIIHKVCYEYGVYDKDLVRKAKQFLKEI